MRYIGQEREKKVEKYCDDRKGGSTPKKILFLGVQAICAMCRWWSNCNPYCYTCKNAFWSVGNAYDMCQFLYWRTLQFPQHLKKERIGGDKDDDLQFSPYWGRRKGLLVINVTLLLLLTRLHSPDFENDAEQNQAEKKCRNILKILFTLLLQSHSVWKSPKKVTFESIDHFWHF